MSDNLIKADRDYLLEYFIQRIKQNKHMIIIVVGPPGTGKTYFAISKAKQLSDMLGIPFTEKNIVLEQTEFIEAINDPELLDPSGANLVFDEVGVTMSSRSWQNKIQNQINFYFQTCRHRNNVIWLTTPSFGFLDKQARTLVNMICEMKSINHKEKVSRCKPLFLQYNQRQDKIYYKFLELHHPQHGNCKIVQMSAKLPPDDLLKAYEVKKRKFTDKIAADMKASITSDVPKEELEPNKIKFTPREDEIRLDMIDCLSLADSAERRGCSVSHIKKIRRILKLKGWTPPSKLSEMEKS